jgi:hypothetical protein
MPGGCSTYQANQLLDSVLGSGTPATVYVGIFTTLPSAGMVRGVEASTGGYQRLAVTNNTTNFPAASNGVKRNGTAISWPPFTDDMPTFVGAGIWDAAAGGNGLLWGPFTTPRTVMEDEPFEIPAQGGTFTVS